MHGSTDCTPTFPYPNPIPIPYPPVADLTCWGHIWSSSVGRLILYRDDRSLVFGETYLLCIYFMQLFLIQVFVIIIFDWIKWIPCNAFWKSNYISYWMLQHIHHTNTNKSRKNNTFVDISFTKELKRTYHHDTISVYLPKNFRYGLNRSDRPRVTRK